eukprot:scaffold10667_cov132-Isochrysis_galbana.AAC.9
MTTCGKEGGGRRNRESRERPTTTFVRVWARPSHPCRSSVELSARRHPCRAQQRPETRLDACHTGQICAFTFPNEAAMTSAFMPNLSVALCGP